MKILPEKELVIKKAIIKAVESGQSAAKLADGFGVSKSTIYKYRRILRDKGFIKKNENNVYVITANKFSKQAQNIATGELLLEINSAENPGTDSKLEINNENFLAEKTKEHRSITEVPTDDAMEKRLQSKIEKMRNTYEEKHKDKGLLRKILSRFKK